MGEQDVKVIVVSHKRAGRVVTHNYVTNALICIPKAQFSDYVQHHPKESLLVHPDDVVGLPAKRQWVIETQGSVFMLDDDCVGLFRIWQGSAGRQKKSIVSPQRTWEIIQATADTARALGAFLFGFASHANPVTFRQLRPFRFGGYSPGGAMGILDGSKLWFPKDTTLPIDDWWICALNAYHHRFAWYDGRWAFGFKDTYTGQGGMAEYRINDAERAATEFLVKNFGQAIVPAKKYNGHETKRTMNRWRRQLLIPYHF